MMNIFARLVDSLIAAVAASVLVVWTVNSSFGGVGSSDVDLQLLATVDDQVVHIANTGVAGDNRLFLVRKIGVIEVFDGASVLGTAFLDIGTLVFGDVLSTGDERGLLSMAFHPDYDTNGFFYVNYIDNSGNTVVARYLVSGNPNIANTVGTPVIDIDQTAGNHNGGQIVFGSDEYLYIGMGDGGGGCDSSGSGCNAQKTNSLLGAMLRIDVDGDDFPMDATRNYAIPGTNPFILDGAVENEIWAYGLRNPWRFSFDRANGDMYIGDVGQSGASRREEINFQAAASTGGENYGWPVAEGDQCDPGTCALGNCPTPIPACDSFTYPLYDYNGGCAVTGGFVYRGADIPELIGRYVFGDYCSGDIVALDVGTLDDPVVADAGTELTTFGEDVNGELYVAVGDDMYRLVSAGTPTETPTSAPTDTPTATPTATPTNTPTATFTSSSTNTPSSTPTQTPTDLPTQTPTETATTAPTPTVLGGGTLDVDGNGQVLASTDGVYVFRALGGLQLIVPAAFRLLDPSIPPDGEISSAVSFLGEGLDVDGDGAVVAATDGVYIFRHLAGLQLIVPPAFRVIDPSIPSDAVIAANVDALVPS